MEPKTNLDHLPRKCQKELAQAVNIIFEEFDKFFSASKADWKKKSRILKIILYGSHARGDFVHDPASGPHSGYVSDYDILIIVNNNKLAQFIDFWADIDDRFIRIGGNRWDRPSVNLIVHSSRDVNNQLLRGRYFFVDIAKEGIVLYKARRTKPLKDPRPMTPKVALEEAQEHFEVWMPSGKGFLDTSRYALSQKRLNESAFQLHQATEHAYRAFLLVMTNYAPKHHDIKKLRSSAEGISQDLIPTWPRGSRKERRLFELLKDAYVKARYSKHYKITKDELDWLAERVAELHRLIERKCKNRITALKRKTKK